MARCIIIAGSPIDQNYAIPFYEDDYIIACDAGYLRAEKLGVTPDLVLGDFDSYTGEINRNIPVLRAVPEKDDTDSLLAIKHALAKGYKEFIIIGGYDGRFDHTIANIQSAAYIAEQGGSCKMLAPTTELIIIKNQTITLKKQENCMLSVFSLNETAVGVTLKGVKYPLLNATITNQFPIGVSNEFTEQYADISVVDGILMVIISHI